MTSPTITIRFNTRVPVTHDEQQKVMRWLERTYPERAFEVAFLVNEGPLNGPGYVSVADPNSRRGRASRMANAISKRYFDLLHREVA